MHYKDDLKKKLMEDPDFIKCAKYGYSLNRYIASTHEDEITDAVIGRLLMLPEEKIEEIYQECVDILKKDMVSLEDEE